MNFLIPIAAVMAGASVNPPSIEAPTTAVSSARISVETTPISEIVEYPEAKAALDRALPTILAYYDSISSMTLAQIAPVSQGRLTPAMLAALQAEFDAIR